MINEKIYEIIEKYDETGNVDGCVEEINEFMEDMISNNEILKFKTFTDTDVFDSCGLDIYYISISWIDKNNDLDICGSRLTYC